MRQLVTTWTLVAGLVLVLGIATVLVVREWRSAEHEECITEYDTGTGGVTVSSRECPSDYEPGF